MATDGERLDALEEHAKKAERGLAEVYGTIKAVQEQQKAHGGAMDILGQKFDRLTTIVTQQQAQPRFNPRDALDSIKSVITIVMMLIVPAAGMLIWMITVVTSAGDAKQNADIMHNREMFEIRIQALEQRYKMGQEFRKGDKL